MGGKYEEPTQDLKHQHIIAAPRHLEDGGIDKKRQDMSRYGGGMTAHRRDPTLLTPAYHPRRHGHGDGTRLSHQ